MKIGFLINDFESFVAGQTTAMMAHSCAERGDDVQLFTISGLAVVQGAVHAEARSAAAVPSRELWVSKVRDSSSVRIEIDELDVVFIRTNPGRDPRKMLHQSALQMLDLVTAPVINSVAGLLRGSSKLYMEKMPAFTRPSTVISSDTDTLKSFVRGRDERSVLKPASGSRGEGVFVVSPDDLNLNALVDLLSRDGLVIAQEFLPDAKKGDVRVVVIDGKPLTVDGATAAIRRVPPKGEFRSNLHTGGHAEVSTLTPGMLRAIDAIGDTLVTDGLRIAGLDFIGDKVCEINVFSTGGLRDAERLYDREFAVHAVDQLLDDRQ